MQRQGEVKQLSELRKTEATPDYDLIMDLFRKMRKQFQEEADARGRRSGV